MIIRSEKPYDFGAIRRLLEAVFGRVGEAVLVDRLRADGDSVISLVAVDGVSVVGHVLLSKMTAPFPCLGLGPVSVQPERQRSGIGNSLIRRGLLCARQGSWDAVFVLGDPEYYRRFGFDAELASDFASPYAGPHLMVMPLKASLPVTWGNIDYAPAFASFG
jgi:putative acetyltransferase